MKNLHQNVPKAPGVYLMKDERGRVLYIGKAADLRRRVGSYFMRAQDARIETLLGRVKKIDYKKTDSALEALILEAKLIKKFQPHFNVREKDDKSFLYIEITKEVFPRVLLSRGRVKSRGSRVVGVYGPFASAASVREALRILRKIFPWSTHADASNTKRPCLDYEIGLCPGTCVGAISKGDYMKNIRRLKAFLDGGKEQVIKDIKREMKTASRNLEFERAAKLRKQIFALRHIHDTALLSENILNPKSYILNSKRRIEGYDVSNISGASAVGSMAVFTGDEPEKSEYRKFKIRTITRADDVGMMREVLRRRLARKEWALPDLILVDGGRGQVNAAKEELGAAGMKLPVVGIAKGPKRRKNEMVGRVPDWVDEKTLIHVRDEAHKLAAKYHRKLRDGRMKL